MMKKRSNVLYENAVVILFSAVCILAFVAAKQPLSFVMSEVLIRIMRNAVMVFSLIIPVVAGIGLNFGVILGAMAAQMSIVFVTHWRIEGIAGFLVCVLFGTIVSLICGNLLGRLFNKTKGKEMITGLIVGFFADGLYQCLFLVIIGGLIHINDPEIIVDVTGTIKDSIKLSDSMKGVLDGVWNISFARLLPWLLALIVIYLAFRTILAFRKKVPGEKSWPVIVKNGIIFAIAVALYFAFTFNKNMHAAANWSEVYMVPVLIAACLAILITLLLKTKIGQDFRAIGQDMNVAASAGINVDKTRIYATVLSTILACWGQLISLQNLGSFSTY